MSTQVWGWRLAGPNKLERAQWELDRLAAGHVVVQVAGCGVCHTDIGFYTGEVPTKRRGPIVLGHEAVGVVVDAAADVADWVGRRALVQAVWVCGRCRPCLGGRPTACTQSLMPGSDADGAFASHVVVPASGLCAVDGEARRPLDAPVGQAKRALWELAVVADAVTTPLQAVVRAHLKKGDFAVVIGVGGVGAFGVQVARSTGAQVAAVDVDPVRLELAKQLGAVAAIDGRKGSKETRAALRDVAGTLGCPTDGWRVFEMSGSAAGQELAWTLLTRGGSISVVGYTPEPAPLRLSNLMAFDATAYGNWGCDPALYPEALKMAADGQIELTPLIRREPLERAPELLPAIQRREIRERVVLVP